MSSKNLDYLDPDNLTLKEIKSRLHQMEVEFDVHQQRKIYFANLYREAIKDHLNRTKIKDKLEQDEANMPERKRTRDRSDLGSGLSLTEKQPKIENKTEEEKNSQFGNIFPVKREVQSYSFQNILRENKTFQKEESEPRERIVSTNFNMIPPVKLEPNLPKIPEETSHQIFIPSEPNVTVISDHHRDAPSNEGKPSPVKNEVTNLNNFPKPAEHSEIGFLIFNNQVKQDKKSSEKKQTTNITSLNINNISNLSNVPTFNPDPRRNSVEPSNNLINQPFQSRPLVTETPNSSVFQKEFEKLKHLARESTKELTKQEKPLPMISPPRNEIPIHTVIPISTQPCDKPHPFTHDVVVKEPVNGARSQLFFPEDSCNKEKIIINQPSVPVIIQFNENDKWKQQKDEKPLISIQLLSKYFLAGLVCSVMFYGLYHCIKNCPSISWEWGTPSTVSTGMQPPSLIVKETITSRDMNLGKIPIDEVVEPTQWEFINFLRDFLGYATYPFAHPQEFMKNVIVKGLKYVITDYIWYYFKNNIWYILGLAALKIIAYKIYKDFSDRSAANRIYREVKTCLKEIYEQNRALDGLTEEEIVRDFSKENEIKEEYFKSNIMPRMRRIRQKDHEVKMFEKEVQGRHRLAWQYTGLH